MHYLSTNVTVGSGPDKLFIGTVVSRLLPASGPGEPAVTQTLVACGHELRPLAGADGRGGLELGPPLQLYADPPRAASEGEPAAARRPYTCIAAFANSVWDPFSSAAYIRQGSAVLRLSSNNTVTVVAGDVEQAGSADGPGRTARFPRPGCLASDGSGSLYLADGNRIRKLQLPGAAPGLGAAQGGAQPSAAAYEGPAAAAIAEGDVWVSTLPYHAPTRIIGLAFDGGSSSGGGGGSLLITTATALYRLPLDDPAAAPTLLAGLEGVDGTTDGLGVDARFTYIGGIALDGEGSLLLLDSANANRAAVRRVTAGGAVTTIVGGMEGFCCRPAILPNGCLAMSNVVTWDLRVLDLGLRLPARHPASVPLSPAVPAGPPPRTLPADLRALLDRQPDGTADVTIVVGGRTFHAHRALLSARSDYFQQRFGGGFVEGSAQQLSLPDTDPDAFEVVLCWVYSGAAAISAVLAAGVAELADRLLLPELREQAAAVVEASVSAGTVVGLLLWAEARGPAFSQLLSRLKGWYVDNHEAVVREAEQEVRLLMARSPGLFLELVLGLGSRPAKRLRTG